MIMNFIVSKMLSLPCSKSIMQGKKVLTDPVEFVKFSVLFRYIFKRLIVLALDFVTLYLIVLTLAFITLDLIVSQLVFYITE